MQTHTVRRLLLLKCLELFDIMVLGGAIFLDVLASSKESRLDLGAALAVRMSLSNVLLLAALLVACHLVFRTCGLYESRRLSTWSAETSAILKAVTLCVLLIGLAASAFEIEIIGAGTSPGEVWRSLTGLWGTFAGMMIGSRALLRRVLARARRKGRNLRHALIVGTNSRAQQLAAKLEGNEELGYRLVGFADDRWSGNAAFDASGRPIVSDLDHLSHFLRESVVDEVMICLPLKSYYERIRAIIEVCETQGIIVRLQGHFFDLRLAQATAETFEDEAVVSVYTGRLTGWPVVAKRSLDIALSASLLVLLAPLCVLAAALVKLTSPGPVFFAQQRVGVNKRPFRVYKFRTMVADAELRQAALQARNEVSGPVFKIAADPRLTPVGSFLRKTSIDELPQLFNVLRGEMSLVGPRPLPLRDYKGFSEDWHRRRFSVQPGITCLWQVNGRSGIPFERWMELDMEYIDHWSFWLDVKILMRTIPAVLRGSGAA